MSNRASGKKVLKLSLSIRLVLFSFVKPAQRLFANRAVFALCSLPLADGTIKRRFSYKLLTVFNTFLLGTHLFDTCSLEASRNLPHG